MSDGDALLQAVLESPGEDTPRLVYADWLQEHGEPDRAEFIRIQVASRSGGPAELHNPEREYGLLLQHWHDWLGRPSYVKRSRPYLRDYFEPAVVFQPRPRTRADHRDAPLVEVLFFKGFAREIECEFEWWLEHGPRVLSRHPVQEVRLPRFRVEIEHLKDGPVWRLRYHPVHENVCLAQTVLPGSWTEAVGQLMLDVRYVESELV